MQIDGTWFVCDDGMTRPVINGEICTSDGSWIEVPFLVDTGADRTALTADVLQILGLTPSTPDHYLGGVGGIVASVIVNTQIRLTREDFTKVAFRGQFAAFTDPDALDMCVLGRDLSNLFAVIVDRPGDRVCLLGQRHHYSIQQG